jgi:hypothetical protein
MLPQATLAANSTNTVPDTKRCTLYVLAAAPAQVRWPVQALSLQHYDVDLTAKQLPDLQPVQPVPQTCSLYSPYPRPASCTARTPDLQPVQPVSQTCSLYSP